MGLIIYLLLSSIPLESYNLCACGCSAVNFRCETNMQYNILANHHI